jgi:Arm DNA-binding domain
VTSLSGTKPYFFSSLRINLSAARLFLLVWTKTNSKISKTYCEIFANKVLKACLGADSRLANTDAECAALTRGPTSETGIGVNDGKPLTALEVKSLSSRGRHAAGKVTGLYLNIGKSGTKSWVFLYQQHGKQREIGLGPIAFVSLEEARQKALEHRQTLFRGDTPLSTKEAARKAVQAQDLTFAAAIEAFLVDKQKVWRARTFGQAKCTLNLAKRGAPEIGSRPLASITREDIYIGTYDPSRNGNIANPFSPIV